LKQWILAHRGEWDSNVSPNSAASILNALNHGFGVETDIRDLNGELVISHNPCIGSNFESFLNYLSLNNRFAINVKSDGLLDFFGKRGEVINESGSFVFDCSFPELLKYKRAGVAHAIRISEFEKDLPWDPNFIWLDAFDSDWWLNDLSIMKIIERIPTIVVSPELHGRNKTEVWKHVLDLRSQGIEISICTDFPTELARAAGIK
jgi:hypothetical protein